MRNHGFVAPALDATAIESVDDDAWLVLESEAERVHRLVIAAGPSGLEYDWSINDHLPDRPRASKPGNEAGSLCPSAQVLEKIRITGFERFVSIHESMAEALDSLETQA